MHASLHMRLMHSPEGSGLLSGLGVAAAAADRWRRWLGVEPSVVAACLDGATRKEAIVDPTLMGGEAAFAAEGGGRGGRGSKLRGGPSLHGRSTAASPPADAAPAAATPADGEEDSDEEEADRLKELNAEQELAEVVEEDEAAVRASAAAASFSSRGGGGRGSGPPPPSIIIPLPPWPLAEPARRSSTTASSAPTANGGRPKPVKMSFADLLAAANNGGVAPSSSSFGRRGGGGYGASTSPLPLSELTGCRDLWGLAPYSRAVLYRHWLRRWHAETADSCAAVAARYAAVSRELAGMVLDEELDVLAGTAVVGMTTTAVAKHRRLLAALKPEIVVVEEAAEVL